ncbi:MAG: hypothetical protein GY715_04905 [Planctomycetes bacterium]|nr:hypothetical protein [Planctomycetota bacterium]
MRIPLLAVILVAVTATALGATGQRNAAYWYREAFQRFRRLRASVPPPVLREDLARVTAYVHDPSAAPAEELRGFLARLDPALGMVRRASARRDHDFDLDYAQGPRIPLPHLSDLQILGRCLAADARVRLHDGDPATAARHLAAVYRMADHARRDRLVRSALSGQSLFSTADRVTRHALDRGAFGPVECGILLDALGRLDPSDPFGLAAGIASERAITMPWYREHYGGDGGLERLRGDLEDFGIDAEKQAAFATMTQEELDASILDAERVMHQVIAAIGLGDPSQTYHELVRLDRQIATGLHGAFAHAVLPEHAPMYARMRRIARDVTDRRALLESITDGRADRFVTANAGVWYLRAIGLLGQLEKAQRDEVRQFTEQPAQPIDAGLAETLQQSDPILDLVRQAAWFPRCDLSVARPRHPAGVSPYHGPIRDLARLLHADVVRCVRIEDYAGAVDRLAASLCLAAHLSRDGRLVSSRLAQVIFDETVALLRPGLDAGLFGEDERARLRRCADRFDDRDPFGFTVAAEAERDELRAWIGARVGATDVDTKRRIGEALDECDGDQLLALAITVGVVVSADTPVAFDSALDDVLDPGSMAEIRRRASDLRAVIASARFHELPELGAVPVAQIESHRRGAVRRVRRSVSVIYGEDEPLPWATGHADNDFTWP